MFLELALFLLVYFPMHVCGVQVNEVCKKCNVQAKFVLNMTFNQAFEHFVPSSDHVINYEDLRPGICETTLLIHKGIIYAHKASRSLIGERKNTIYLRHKEFFKALIAQILESGQILNVTIPNLIFNLETKDNPTCLYPSSERNSGKIRAVKGLFHHSFCSPKLCDGTLLLPMSYNQNMAAMEATSKIDSICARISWNEKRSTLFWRGSNAGKVEEYAHFGWKHEDMPRKKAVEMCKARKDADVKFGFISWKTFMKHKYILALAGNTYSSLFKHALRSGACILRQDERMYEWFEPFVNKWVHYVPIRWDLSNMFSQLQWVKDNHNEAEAIGKRAQILGEALFSPQIMACYTYCNLVRYHGYLNVGFDENLLSSFMPVYSVCNSKRKKKKDCSRIEISKMMT